MKSIKTHNLRGVSRGCKGTYKGKQNEAFLCLFFVLVFSGRGVIYEHESSRKVMRNREWNALRRHQRR